MYKGCIDHRIILIDEDQDAMATMAKKLNSLGYYNLEMIKDPLKAVTCFQRDDAYDLALIEIHMSAMNGLTLIERIKNSSPKTECIMVTGINNAETAVVSLRKGAYDYLVKPITKSVLALALPKALERKKLLDILELNRDHTHYELKNAAAFQRIITRAPEMKRVLKVAELHAAGNSPILITGESGTGKQLLARAIHAASTRSSYPFRLVNTASTSEHDFEAELFGNASADANNGASPQGGFLDNIRNRTLFLDEIGDLSQNIQSNLLKIIQNGEYYRTRDKTRYQTSVRFIAATNEDLNSIITRGAFRKDLFGSLRGGWIHLPPLRERTGDVALLAESFIKTYLPYPEKELPIYPQALETLMAYNWPGNIRELKLAIQTAAHSARGNPIDKNHLPEQINTYVDTKTVSRLPGSGRKIRLMAEIEKEHILEAFRRLNHNKTKTARALGIGLNTLRRKLEQYDKN